MTLKKAYYGDYKETQRKRKIVIAVICVAILLIIVTLLVAKQLHKNLKQEASNVYFETEDTSSGSEIPLYSGNAFETVNNAFISAVGRQVTDPKLPIVLASADDIESFSPPIFAAYCSKNGKVCTERLSAYKRIIAPMRYELYETDGKVKLVIEASKEELTMPQFLVETEMVFIINIIRKATKSRISPVEVLMQQPVTDKEFKNFTDCAVKKSNENALIFTTEDMEKPFISFNEGMWNFFEPELQKRLYEMEKDDTFAAKVRSALTELLPGGGGTADGVAEKLGISKRTLQRKLTEEDTSFQKQLNGVRELLAKHYIKNTDMSTDDIAFLLGYQELNSFLRAFSIWTGISVSEYKKKSK